MSDLAGEVRRIGIRATTVRTWEGAEVIVPNASLVSEKLTNWTYSDRVRRMDVPVGVAYGSAPEKVLELLLAVAHAHPGVLAQPAPEALFMGFGESAPSRTADHFDTATPLPSRRRTSRCGKGISSPTSRSAAYTATPSSLRTAAH